MMPRSLLSAFFLLIGLNSQAYHDKLNGPATQLYALVISVGSYPEQPSWPKADSRQDIENIQSFIKKINPFNDVKVLKDEAATRKNILDNLNAILTRVKSGDKVYIHFSGGGFQVNADTVIQVFMPYDAPSVEDVTDAVMNSRKPDLSKVITDKELITVIQKIRLKTSVTGQCLFTIDASHFGPRNAEPRSIIGRGGFFKITDFDAGLASFNMITSCLDSEESYFIGDKEPLTRSFSKALKIFSENVKSGSAVTYGDLFAGLKKQMAIISPGQTPATTGNDNTYVFGVGNADRVYISKDNLVISPAARLYILSIGISNYTGPYQFSNCDDDAIMFADIMRSQWGSRDTSKIRTWLLLNNAASKEAILSAINEIISMAGDEDVFAFFFAGFTNEPKNPGGSFQETWFYPKTDKRVNINSRTGFNEKEVLTLKELKKLFDYLKCDKQLLFTEAGLTENFRREFIRSMIKTNPVLTEIRKRNRVIIVPDKEGFDNLDCDGKAVKHGPGLYFFSQLINNAGNGAINIYNLFSNNEATRREIVYKYRNEQFKCKYGSQYISFFFEKEFVEDLQYYFSKDIAVQSNSRGAGENEDDQKLVSAVNGNRYALVIGTNKFSSWRPLQNPVNDANSIADTLRDLFGYKTTLLINPSVRDIYNSLYSFRGILKENDQFVLYLAGHGYYDSTIFRDGFIVTSDSKALRSDTFLTSYIPFSQLRSITDNYNAKQIMVLLDVCFSGAFDEVDQSLGGNINYNLTGKLTDRTVGKKLQMTTRKYITAGSRTEEVADDYNGAHSPFAYFLLEGLRRAAKEKKYLSSGMLFKFIQAYLEDTVPLQAGFGKDQEKSGSEFIFIAK